MKTPELLALGFAAFALGAWLGRGGAARPADAPPALGSAAQSASAQGEATAPPGDDARADAPWSRLLSALHEPLHLRQRALLAEAVGFWTAADLAAAISRAEKLPGRFSHPVLQALVARWFELDADAAARWTRGQRDPAFLRLWALHQPEAAFQALALRRPEEIISGSLGGGLDSFEWIAPEQIAERTRHVVDLPSGAGRKTLLWLLLGNHWAVADPAAALAFARALPDGPERDENVSSILATWMQEQPGPALAATRTLLPTLGDRDFILNAAAALASKDLAAARRWATELPAELRPAAAASVAGAWLKTEPRAALEWAHAQGWELTSEARNMMGSIHVTLLTQAMLDHPAETTSWLLARPPGEDRDRLLEVAAVEKIETARWHGEVTGTEPWLRELWRAAPAEARARIERRLGEKAGLLRGE